MTTQNDNRTTVAFIFNCQARLRMDYSATRMYSLSEEETSDVQKVKTV